MNGTLRNTLFLLVFVLAAALRLSGLDHDPPSYNVLPDAAPWTDEGTIGLPALQAAHGAIPLAVALSNTGRPIHRLLLFGIFHVVEPARLAGRLLSAVLGLAGLLGLAALGQMLWPGIGGLAALLLGATGFFFAAYDRLLLSEGPLVALLTLLAVAGVRLRGRSAAFATGAGIALAAVGFKMQALALFPTLALLYYLRRRSLLLPLSAGLVAVLFAWRVLFVPSAAPIYLSYLDNRITGTRFGLVSPSQALLQLLQAGIQAAFLPYQLPLLVLVACEASAFLLAPRRWLAEADDVLVVSAIWLVVAVGSASLFRYLPPRYFHIASPALVLVALAGARRLWEARSWPSAPRSAWRALTLGMGGLVLYQGLAAPFVLGRSQSWVSCLNLPLLAFFVTALSIGRRWVLQRPELRAGLLAILLFCQLVVQSGLYAQGVLHTTPALAQIARALATSLPPNSVVAGRLAGTMALAAPMNGMPFLDNISLTSLEQSTPDHDVWVLILNGDEKRVASELVPYLTFEASFPLQYSPDQSAVNLYRFNAAQATCVGAGSAPCPSSRYGSP